MSTLWSSESLLSIERVPVCLNLGTDVLGVSDTERVLRWDGWLSVKGRPYNETEFHQTTVQIQDLEDVCSRHWNVSNKLERLTIKGVKLTLLSRTKCTEKTPNFYSLLSWTVSRTSTTRG